MIKPERFPIRFFLVLLSIFSWVVGVEAGTVGKEERTGHDETGESELKTWLDPVTGMEFVWIPEGCFEMGSPPEEAGRDPDEGPRHEVCVNGFWMGKYEVTREQFRKFVESTAYRTDAEKGGFSWVYSGEWEKKPGYNWLKSAFDQNDRHPVIHVSWNDAEAMADWLSEQSKGTFRLPTEAEWEYACRAGTQTARYWGDDPDKSCAYANGADLSAQDKFPGWTVHPCEDGHTYTAPAGTFRPNRFGLHDMLGNVWEWCEDGYSRDAYGKHSKRNPLYRERESGRVIRGGSWYSRPILMRCASRDTLQLPDRRGDDVGFRLIRNP